MRPIIRNSFAALACLLSLTAAVTPSAAQQNNAEQHLLSARALYYTPTTEGLKSFHCAASIDWKDLLTRFGGQPIADDNPFLVYLKTVHLSVSDDLSGKGSLEWVDTAPPSDALSGPAEKIRAGLVQTLGGFFQAWNPFMNGSLVPVPDASTNVSAIGDNIKLHATSDSTNVDEIFDKNLLLTSVHVVTPDMDATMHPTYLDTRDGRILSVLNSTTSQPPTAPPMNIIMSTTYTRISSFQLPATASFDIKNVGAMTFHFSACTVQTSAKAADKP